MSEEGRVGGSKGRREREREGGREGEKGVGGKGIRTKRREGNLMFLLHIIIIRGSSGAAEGIKKWCGDFDQRCEG